MDHAHGEGDARIRPYRAWDLGAVYEICLRTGDAGGDATDQFGDRRLPGDLFAAPYALFEPEHAFVLDDGTGAAVGYVLAARDTCGFEEICERRWWPGVRRRHPERADGTGAERVFTWLAHHRPEPDATLLDRFPSHLHIDLLPAVQGAGWGRRMMHRVFDALAESGSPGVHWGVSTRNHAAMGFYEAMGATVHGEDPHTVTYAVDLRGRLR